MKNLNEITSPFRTALFMVKVFPRSLMARIRISFFIAFAISTLTALVYWQLAPNTYEQLAFGIALITLGLWWEQILIYSYHNYWYFKGMNSVLEIPKEGKSSCTYELAELVQQNPNDLSSAFMNHNMGKEAVLRSEISQQFIVDFLKSERQLINAQNIFIPEGKIWSIFDLGCYLFDEDGSFRSMFTEHGINKDDFVGALGWVVRQRHQAKRSLRWWSKDRLSQFEALGADWSFGTTYQLERFTKSIYTGTIFSGLAGEDKYQTGIMERVEATMSRSRSANVLIVGEPGVGKLDILANISKRIRVGKSHPDIINHNILLLDANKIFAVCNDKKSLELTLINLLNEATHAGNIILVIDNISNVINEAETFGVNLKEILGTYLSSPSLHIIATDTPAGFHNELEVNVALSRQFDVILLEQTSMEPTLRLLENIAYNEENKRNISFSYNSIRAVAQSAERYLTNGVMPDKAVGLLVEIATLAGQKKDYAFIDESYIYEYVSNKTGIPIGNVKDGERELLLHLEDTLHENVIGQDEALKAVASTMRRSRAGIVSPERPLGSFLFLGPTGVGKTETAKTLAMVFFQDKTKMVRFDMSEFSGGDALPRLIGTRNSAGLLADSMQEHPYTVLLLDEFEKADVAVHDLFLQILDEGKFTTGKSQTVNMRNTIIIATSNAGSALIMASNDMKQGISSKEIVGYIIKERIFKPELINRFDNVSLFRPLNRKEQEEIAELMLKALIKRISERGYRLSFQPDLVPALVDIGYSVEFGARSLRRVVQDELEEIIAKRIISGEVNKGDEIILSASDLQNL